MSTNVLLKIKYDGSGFHGWQKQQGLRTVQGEIEYVLGHLLGEPVNIQGTSRTDRGVHALEQCASFCWNNKLPTNKLQMILNRRFGAGGSGRSGAPGDIEIISAQEVPDDFHARYSCTGKKYRYVIERHGDPFSRNFCWQFPENLNMDDMKTAAHFLVGTHDFSSFQSSGGTPRETTVRTINEITVANEGCGRVIIEVEGDGFLYNMVRIIVGTLVEVGIGRRSSASMAETIAICDRAAAGMTAPPQGLYLKKIYFDESYDIRG